MEGHFYMMKTNNTFSLKLRTRKLTGWYSGNALEFYSRGARFNYLPRRGLP
jgi:hypothetical protein